MRSKSYVELLFPETQSKIKAYLSGYHRDKHEVEDISQTAWLKLSAAERNGKINSIEHAEKLLYVIARTLALKYIEKMRPVLRDDVVSTQTGAVLDITGKESISAHDALVLLEVVEKMPKNIKQIFNLMRKGKTEAEIAKQFGVTEAAIKMRWLRYTRALRGSNPKIVEPNQTQFTIGIQQKVTLRSNTANSNTNVTL